MLGGDNSTTTRLVIAKTKQTSATTVAAFHARNDMDDAFADTSFF